MGVNGEYLLKATYMCEKWLSCLLTRRPQQKKSEITRKTTLKFINNRKYK